MSKIPLQDLFNNNRPNIPIKQLLQTERTRRIRFITTWHQKLSRFQSTIHHRYQEMINDYPQLKCVFPAPPILAYRRNRNLGNLLVHASLTKPTPNTLHPSGYSRPCKSNRHCKLCPSMSNTNSVTNHLTNKTSYTDGAKCNTKYTIYAAECTKHNLLYIGQSSQKLNCRFNGHRSDVRVKPKACELTKHFSQSKNCKIDNDLRVYILQDNLDDSSSERMEYFEDRWITRLDTKAPNGMNTKLNYFAKIFYQLF